MSDTPLFVDFSSERPIIGLSGGINSAGLLCYLASELPKERRPSELLLYYTHLREHSPGTARFVFDQVRYARSLPFWDTTFRLRRASMNDWIRDNNMIPHPAVSPCTSELKIEPMQEWAEEQGATCDLIGYVKSERRRRKRQSQYGGTESKRYPICHLGDEDCFQLVEREIGWYPDIYDIRGEGGKRVFLHNNCLPCKNMTQQQRSAVERHYPKYAQRARDVAEEVGSYWGRNAEDYNGDPCSYCAFD